MDNKLKILIAVGLIVIMYLILKRFPAVAKRLMLICLTPVIVLAVIICFIRYFTTIVTNPDKAFRIAIGADQWTNVSLNGSEDETISSRAYRAMLEKQKWGCFLCKFLDIFEKDHCKKSLGT